jgi:hypothetical protein
MSKDVTITVEDYELKLLQMMLKVIDFYGDGYDDHRNVNDNDTFPDGNPSSGEAFANIVKKLSDAYNG